VFARRFLLVCILASGGTFLPRLTCAATWQTKVDPRLLDATAQGRQTEILVLLTEKADLTGARQLKAKNEKGAHVHQHLIEAAARTQVPLLKILQSRHADYRSFWIANMIWVRADRSVLQTLAQHTSVLSIIPNTAFHLQEPATPHVIAPAAGIEWNILQVSAPEVWALGYSGQGVVIGGQDTGYQWDHPALINHYRGWDGTNSDHNYNWHDAIHSNDVHNTGANPCGYNLLAPCDDDDHGTHTMGTMVGDDGSGNQIGMAPRAKWIGCRNMERGWGTASSYLECFQWFLAPTDLNNENPDPSKAPNVINNSWYSDSSEGTTNLLIFQTAVEALRAAGIVVVVSAGNQGSGCSTITSPAIYDASFSVGATDNNDNIAGFSSRGPVTVDSSNRLKPNISAPGVNIRSSIPNGAYASGWSGTSMAGPHVVGLVALLLSAHPELRGNVDMIEYIIEHSAIPRTTTADCGGLPTNAIPNNTYGWGRIDALATLGLKDSDGDGMTDYQEYLAGTNHHDPASVLRITGIQGNLISFTTVSNRFYSLESKDDLAASTWNTNTNITGTGGILAVPDLTDGSSTQRFYHIRLMP